VDTPRRDGLVRGAESQDRLDLAGGAQCDGVAAVEACLVPVHLGEREDLASGIAGAAGADGGPDADGLRDVHAGIGRVELDAALGVQHDLPSLKVSRVPCSGGASPRRNSRPPSLLVIQLMSRVSRRRSSAAAWNPSISPAV